MVIGVDWGEKNLGVAFANRAIAAPLKTLRVKNKLEAITKIKSICQELEVTQVVLGLPLGSEGQETPQSVKIRAFGKELQEILNRKVIFWNEILSSREALAKKLAAGRGQKARRQLDAAAAAVILQSYLDAQSEKEDGHPTPLRSRDPQAAKTDKIPD